MTRKLPPLTALKSFEAAARHESLTEAANELSISASAVSQQIKNLEAYIGKSLFTRKGRAVCLTPLAKAYFEDVRYSLDLLALASEKMKGNGNKKALKINTTPSFAMRWLIPKLPEFQQIHPNIEVNIVTSPVDTISSLENNFDIIVRRGPMAKTGYICELFLEDVMVAVTSPNSKDIHLFSNPQNLRDKATLLHLKSRVDAWKNWFDIAGISMPNTPDGQIFDHFFLSLQAAINGMGVALAPRSLIQDDLEHDRLIQLCPDIELKGPGFHALYRTTAENKRSTIPFITWMFETARTIA